MTDAVQVVRNDPALDAIVPPQLTAERLADGFLFTEGPVWVPDRLNVAGAGFARPTTN
jgi:gluconolactonase